MKYVTLLLAALILIACDDSPPPEPQKFSDGSYITGVPPNMKCILGHEDHFLRTFVCDKYVDKGVL